MLIVLQPLKGGFFASANFLFSELRFSALAADAV
jgi:hypothetical protein